MTFTDDFERDDLGPDWVDGPLLNDGYFAGEDHPHLRADSWLSAGAWECADVTSQGVFETATGSIRRAATVGVDQFIEAQVGNFFQGHNPDVAEWLQWVEGDFYLFAQINAGSNACVGAHFYISVGSNTLAHRLGDCYVEIITLDHNGYVDIYGDGFFAPLTGWQSNPTYTVRLEVSAEGHCRAYFEGNLLAEDDVWPVGGTHVGISMEWNRTRYSLGFTNPGQSLRVLSVTGSESICTSPPNYRFDQATVVPTAGYSGSVCGGSTLCSLSVEEGSDARYSYWVWRDLPPGNVSIYVQPRPDYGPEGSDAAHTLLVGWGEPDTEGGSGEGGVYGGYGNPYGGEGRGTAWRQVTHHGGQMYANIYTWMGDNAGFEFDFAWGHELDADPAHWGPPREDSWSSSRARAPFRKFPFDAAGTFSSGGLQFDRQGRGSYQAWLGPVPGTTPPAHPGTMPCAYESARHGADWDSSPEPAGGTGSIGCAGPEEGPGALLDIPDTGHVGTRWEAVGMSSWPGPVQRYRMDQLDCWQYLNPMHLDGTFRGPVPSGTVPYDFAAYQAANEGVVGFRFVDAAPVYQTRNYNLGSWYALRPHEDPSGFDDTVPTLTGPCTVSLRLLDPSVIYPNSGYPSDNGWSDTPDNVMLRPPGDPGGAIAYLGPHFYHSYITPERVLGTEIAQLTETPQEIVIPDRATFDALLVSNPGEPEPRWLLAAFVSEELVAGVEPPTGPELPSEDIPLIGFGTRMISDAVRSLKGGPSPSFEFRVPTWQPYILPTIECGGGWRVGGVGTAQWAGAAVGVGLLAAPAATYAATHAAPLRQRERRPARERQPRRRHVPTPVEAVVEAVSVEVPR